MAWIWRSFKVLMTQTKMLESWQLNERHYDIYEIFFVLPDFEIPIFRLSSKQTEWMVSNQGHIKQSDRLIWCWSFCK